MSPRLSATTSATVLASVLAFSGAQAQWSVDAGVEHFDWREHTAPIEVHEHGPRFFLAAGWMLPKARGPLIAIRGEGYGGNVQYDGSFQFDATRAASGHSTYWGTRLTAQARWRWAGAADAVAGLEYETWKRQLSRAQEEDYRVGSLRLGVEHLEGPRVPLLAGGGVRLMLSAEEDARVEYSGVPYTLHLKPGRRANPFFHAGIRWRTHWTLLGFWDGMSLGRSNTVALVRPFQPTAFVWQPETDVSRVGMRVSFAW